ncbi:MAG: DUF362 domain-containing protein [Acidobacteria bacterium]|nr:DUF362 domain-containing protein [Acidobacteriota bacterium]
MDRRAFVKSTLLGGPGLVFQVDQGVPAQVSLPQPPPIEVHGGAGVKATPLSMPGLYPGRVVEVSAPQAIQSNRVSQPVVARMIERGLKELTEEKSLCAAWSKFVQATDVVGIKINPSGAPACCSSPEIIREIIRGLECVGVPKQNIVVWDRYAYEIDIGGYQSLLPPGVEIVGIEAGVGDVSGYDLNIYCEANFFGEWETRSYMADVAAHRVTKLINVPTTKDHSASGVTGCLKNLGYGTFNNVARSHRAPYSFTNPLIGLMCSAEPLRSKAVLHIMDGMRLVWHGGPLTQIGDFIEQVGTVFIGTDPVALDTMELQAVESKRRQKGVPSVWEHNPKSITTSNDEFFRDPSKNLFYRQPGHIQAADKLGLGISDLKRIDHRIVETG